MSVIKLTDSANLDRVKDLLKREGIEFEIGSAFEMFCYREADFRLGNFEDYERVEFPEELRDEMESRITDRWFNEDILNYDYMDDIVDEEVHHVLGENDLTLESFQEE